MKKLVAICLLTAVVVGASAAAVGTSASAAPAGDLGRLNSFSYSYGSFHSAWEYSLIRSGDEVLLMARGYSGVNLNVNKKLRPQVLDQLAAIIMDNGITAWDGFNGQDPGVMDGYGFSLTAVFERGSLTAEGYMKEPKNYQKGHQALAAFLESLVDSK